MPRLTPARLAIMATSLLSLCGIPDASGQSSADGRTTFVIRADSSVAPQVNNVLKSIAEPIDVTLGPGAEPKAVLADLCGAGALPEYELIDVGEGATAAKAVHFTPCVRQRTSVRVLAREGDTREAIAVRLGLRPSSWKELVATRKGSRLPTMSRLAIGDVVTAKAVPSWTRFAPRQGTVMTRDNLVALIEAALSKTVGCPQPISEETCLHPRGVIVLADARPASLKPGEINNTAIRSPIGSLNVRRRETTATLTPVSFLRFAPGGSQASHDEAWSSAAVAEDPQPQTAPAGMGPASPIPSPTPTPGAAPSPAASHPVFPRSVSYPTNLTQADMARAGVADGQWPEDQGLVAEIIKASGRLAALSDTVVGVADNGLAGPMGAPFTQELFVNDVDNGTGVDGDVIGAGIPRSTTTEDLVGDVSICSSPPTPGFSAWDGKKLEVASHGSIVTSLASGFWLRKRNGGGISTLPRVQFFRLASDLCAGTLGNDDQAGVDAIEYMSRTDVRILNVSSLIDGAGGQQFSDRVRHLFEYAAPLTLVLAAGNAPVDLDSKHPCPPCLGSITKAGVTKHVVVVGAATRDLRIAPYSNRGFGTVRIFAPGEATGAINLIGADASAYAPSTSYAAPRVSLAAALIRMMGIDDPAKLRDRLLLSTWPLFKDDGTTVGLEMGPIDVGVLDLAKAAAVRFDSIEVIEKAPDSDALVRRTYVGDITSGLDGICPGFVINGGTFLAVKLGPVNALGQRAVSRVSRSRDSENLDPSTDSKTCRPSGTIKLSAVRDGLVELPMSAVTQIIFRRWNKRP